MTVPDAMFTSKMHLNNGEHMLIPVNAKMIHSTVSIRNRFILKNCCPLHMVKLVGVVRNYHDNTKNITINVEDGTGLVQVIVWHEEQECKAVLVLSQEFKGNGDTQVIGEVIDYYDVKEIIAFDACPVSSSNELTYHYMEVAYSFEKMMECAEDEELKAVDLNKLICKHRKAIGKVENEPLTTVRYVEKEELSSVDFNKVITKFIKDFANQKDGNGE
jgi:hypothetical protein